jgi:hypothetical protein
LPLDLFSISFVETPHVNSQAESINDFKSSDTVFNGFFIFPKNKVESLAPIAFGII